MFGELTFVVRQQLLAQWVKSIKACIYKAGGPQRRAPDTLVCIQIVQCLSHYGLDTLSISRQGP